MYPDYFPMPTLEEIKGYVKELSAEEKLALWSYATAEWTKEKQSAEELKLLQSLPTPITDSDKAFIEKHKNNKNIKRDKIQFTENTIELDGLKFPRTIAKYDDIKNTPWLKLNNNVYQKDGYDYFTRDAVHELSVKEWSPYKGKVPSKGQRQKAADVFGWYGLLGQILNYPKAGVRRSNGLRDYVGTVSELCSSTPHGDSHVYSVWFTADGGGSQNWNNQDTARSLVFLQG